MSYKCVMSRALLCSRSELHGVVHLDLTMSNVLVKLNTTAVDAPRHVESVPSAVLADFGNDRVNYIRTPM